MPFNTTENINYYEILGLNASEKNLSSKRIEKHFRDLAKKIHPDKYSSIEATERMRQLIESRDTLIDPLKRRKYDATLPEANIASYTQQLRLAEIFYNESIKTTETTTFYRLRRQYLRSGIDQLKQAISEYGYSTLHAPYFREYLSSIEGATLYKNCITFEYVKTVSDHLIDPLVRHIEILKVNSSEISTLKVSQINTAIREIELCLFNSLKYGIQATDRPSHYDEWSSQHIEASVEWDHCDWLTAIHIRDDIQQLMHKYANSKILNTERNYVGSIFKALMGTCILLATAIPTAGLLLVSRTYRNAIAQTFFMTKTRASFEHGINFINDEYVYKQKYNQRMNHQRNFK